MINLSNTTDVIDIVTSSAATLDVVASFTDYASGPTFTPGRQLTAISSATTTTIVSSPAASTTRNAKTITIRNKGAALACVVTVRFNANGTAYEIDKRTLNPGDQLQYLEGVGWFTTRNTNSPLENSSVSDQTLTSADTYLVNSGIPFAGRIQSGSRFKWAVTATKTGAGTATPIYQLRCGTAGTTADTSRASFTGVAQTAAADTAWWDIEAIVRTTGASGVLQVSMVLAHNLASTGFANVAGQVYQTTTAAFDLTVANSLLGWSFNPGASGVWTVKSCSFFACNLLT